MRLTIPSPSERKVLQRLYQTGLINNDQNNQYFPIRSYLACKGRTNVSNVSDAMLARFQRLSKIAPELTEETITTCLLAHDNIHFVIEAVQSLAHVSKEQSERIRYFLKGLHTEYKVTDPKNALYSIPEKHVTKLELDAVAQVRIRWAKDLAREIIDPKTNMDDMYTRLAEMVETGLFGVRKALDRVMTWCNRSGGFSNKLYTTTSTGGIRLARREIFLDLQETSKRAPCKPLQSNIFRKAKKRAQKNRKDLAQIPKGTRAPGTRVPSKGPKNTRPAYLKYGIQQRREAKLLSQKEMIQLMNQVRLKDRQMLRKRKANKPTNTKQMALRALSSPKKTGKRKKSSSNNNGMGSAGSAGSFASVNNWNQSNEMVHQNYNYNNEQSKEKNYR